nr:hypothetical protein [Tanacetum cinerariifolium]
MGDANPIRTLGDYSRPSHEGYRNTIELPEGTNVVTLRSDTIRDFTKPVKAISLPQDVPSTSDRRLIELENQVQHLMETYIAPMQPTQTISEKLDDAPIRNTAGSTTAQMNFTFTNYPTKEELRGQGIKSPSKLLSPKYLSQSSLAKQNRNPSSLKCVHFVNSIVLLNKEDAAKEEGNVKSCITEYKDHEMTVESEKEFEEETKEEIKEEKEDSLEHFDTFPTIKELRYHEWLLKNPRPPWVKAKIRTENLNNVKFSFMIVYFDKNQAYLDVESPINVMSRIHYNWIMSKRNFTYKCDFVVLEDTTSVIDHDLGSVVFRKPFVEATGLVMTRRKEHSRLKIRKRSCLKFPTRCKMFKHIDFTNIKTDRIPPFVIESGDDNSEKTHYSDSLDLGPEYKYNENVCRTIQSLIVIKVKINKGEIT